MAEIASQVLIALVGALLVVGGALLLIALRRRRLPTPGA